MRTLIHMCCAPCAVSVFDYFVKQKEYEIEGLYYNPNIHPIIEFNKRLESVELLSEKTGIKANIINNYDLEYWKDNLAGDKNKRCSYCYNNRLEFTASYAEQNNFDSFTTTLLISPYQNHDLIKEIADKYAKIYNVQFYYHDFREVFRQGQKKAGEMGLYKQKYCGCVYSYNESDYKKKPVYEF